jgi:hypothetical protein
MVKPAHQALREFSAIRVLPGRGRRPSVATSSSNSAPRVRSTPLAEAIIAGMRPACGPWPTSSHAYAMDALVNSAGAPLPLREASSAFRW